MSASVLVNNLENITLRDAVYRANMSRLYKLLIDRLPDDLKGLAAMPQIPVLTADSYFMHYSVTPRLRAENPDQLLQKVLEFKREYATSENYKRIKLLTTLDDALSSIYSITLSTAVLKGLKKELEKLPQDKQEEIKQQLQQLLQLQGRRQSQGEKPPVEEVGEEGEGTGFPTEVVGLGKRLGQQLGSSIDIKKVIKEASDKAEEVTRKLGEVEKLIGGREAGKEPGTIEFLTDLASKILEERVEVKVLELAGRIADSLPKFVKMRKEKDVRGDELAGYRLTKDVEKALPRELALPDEVFYYKLASGGLLSKEKLVVKEGAYYILVDKSGSMDGVKTIWARAVALALLKLAREKKRKYFLRLFDYRVYDLLDDSDPRRLLKHILEVEANGGTSIDTAIRTALEDLEKHRLIDLTNTIIVITDGEDTVTVKPEELKKLNATLVAVMIQGHNDALRGLAEATGGMYMKAELDVRGALKLVSAVK